MNKSDVILDNLNANLEKLWQNGVLTGKRIFLIGPWDALEASDAFLREHKLCAELKLNDHMQYIATIDRAPCTVESCLKEYIDNAVILISSKHAAELAVELESYGYMRNKHFFVVQKRFGWKVLYDDSEEMFNYYAQTIQLGRGVYENLLCRHPSLAHDGSKLLIAPSQSNGDLYIADIFLWKYLHDNHIQDYVITIAGKACHKMADCLDWKITECLSYEESCALLAYARFDSDLKSKTLILSSGIGRTSKNSIEGRIRGYLGLDMVKIAQQVIYQQPITNNHPGRIFDVTQKEIMDYAHDIGMEPGRSVIIAPFAYSVLCKENMFLKIAAYCRDLGYKVFMNCNEADRRPEEWITTILPPFHFMQGLVEYAGCFIGLRSGLCDIISPAKAKKIIIHPAGTSVKYGCEWIVFMGLNSTGLCSDALELSADYRSWPDVEQRIKNELASSIV